MCLLLREAMNVGRFAIHRLFFSIELELLEARKRVKDELLNYCVVTEAAKTTFGKVQPLTPTPLNACARGMVRRDWVVRTESKRAWRTTPKMKYGNKLPSTFM